MLSHSHAHMKCAICVSLCTWYNFLKSTVRSVMTVALAELHSEEACQLALMFLAQTFYLL